jgi:hypothetical protein
MALQPAEWQRYEPVDDGTAVRIVANMGALELRRVDVEDGPDAVTITIYEDLPDGVGVIPAIGIGATSLCPPRWRAGRSSTVRPVNGVAIGSSRGRRAGYESR